MHQSNKRVLVISDRRADIYQSAKFCQSGCSYSGVNYELMTANCICDSSLLQNSSNNNDINNGNNKNNEEENITFKTLTKSFVANLLDFNFDIFKCHNLVFNSKILNDNIGFYCLALTFILQIIFLFVFLIKRLKPIKLFMLIFHNSNQKTSNYFPPPKNQEKIRKNKNIYFENDKSNKYNHDLIKVKEYPFNFNHIKAKEEINDINSLNNLIKSKREGKFIFIKKLAPIINIQKSIININGVKKKKKSNKIMRETLTNESKLYTKKSTNKILYKNKNNEITHGPYSKKEKKMNISNLRKNQYVKNLSKVFDDLQNIDYEQAIIYDKRNYLRIYWAYLVQSQIILGTFCTENHLTLFVIKLSFLVCTFQISFFLNAFFYTDEYISNAYHNDGVLDFFSGLPKSIYSLLATIAITNILNILSNSKNELMMIIQEKREHKNYLHIINIKLKKLRNKLIIYFILVFLLGALFLYYICSFCSVYKCSQKYWFIGCLQSVGIDFLIAMIICMFLAFFRYLAIKKHLKCFYILANIISNFL